MFSAMRVDVQKINCLSGLIDGRQLKVLFLGRLEMLMLIRVMRLSFNGSDCQAQVLSSDNIGWITRLGGWCIAIM